MPSNTIKNIVSPKGDSDDYKEFENKKGFYIFLTIIIYNTKNLDGIKYEINFNKEIFDRMSNIFKNLEIRDIFNKIKDILNDDNYKIKKSGSYLLLTLMSKNEKRNDKN